jgi:transposase
MEALGRGWVARGAWYCVVDLRELDEHLAWCDQRIAQHARDNPQVKACAQLMGIGVVGASAAVATVDDFAQFNNGARHSSTMKTNTA